MCNVGRPIETASIIHVLSRVGGLKLETVFFLAIILVADFIKLQLKVILYFYSVFLFCYFYSAIFILLFLWCFCTLSFTQTAGSINKLIICSP